MALHIRRADAPDTDTIVRILIGSKEASFPDTIDDHDRDVPFWTTRWHGYITKGSRAQQSLGDGWVFLADLDGVPVGYVAYHHTTRHGTHAELQNIYVLKDAQGRGVGTHLLGVVAHRLQADGSQTMCVGYDADSPYTRFYFKHGAVEIGPGAPWAIWHHLGDLAARLPRPPEDLMTDLGGKSVSWLRRLFVAVLVTLGLVAPAAAGAQAAREFKDVTYASVDGKDLGLDVYVPAGVQSPPLLVWVHGGAWSSGTRAQPPMIFVANGFALASLDFRQSTEARFPAQVHDIKAAIRFLRAKAATYGYRTDRIAIGGSSSGGHLAALVGVTNGHAELEGTVGGHAKESSAVQAILDYYGASNLTTILAQSTPFGLNMRRPALERLLGAAPDQAKELATLASPVAHVDRGDPPLHLLHGDQDPQMPINQSHELAGAYQKLGLDVSFDVVYGAAHGGDRFLAGEYLARAVAFLRRTLATP